MLLTISNNQFRNYKSNFSWFCLTNWHKFNKLFLFSSKTIWLVKTFLKYQDLLVFGSSEQDRYLSFYFFLKFQSTFDQALCSIKIIGFQKILIWFLSKEPDKRELNSCLIQINWLFKIWIWTWWIMFILVWSWIVASNFDFTFKVNFFIRLEFWWFNIQIGSWWQ